MSKLCLLEIEFTLLPQKRREFAQSLELLSGLGRGLIRRSIYLDRDEPDRVLWVEEWSNRQALESHLETGSFRALVGGLRVLGNVHDCRLVDFSSNVTTVSEGRQFPRYLRGKLISET
jgi:quinol monooxygenase YgiN